MRGVWDTSIISNREKTKIDSEGRLTAQYILQMKTDVLSYRRAEKKRGPTVMQSDIEGQVALLIASSRGAWLALKRGRSAVQQKLRSRQIV